MRRLSFWLITGILLLAFLTVWIHPVSAQMPTPGSTVPIYLFIGEGCPHCAKAKPYFETLAETYPEINMQIFEVYYNAENQALFLSIAELPGFFDETDRESTSQFASAHFTEGVAIGEISTCRIGKGR